jgi:hypothetical protein
MDGSAWLDLLQWPALVVTVVAAWLVSGDRRAKREIGFWIFLLSNVLWIIWGFHSNALALVLLQFCLAVSNIHGMIKNRRAA